MKTVIKLIKWIFIILIIFLLGFYFWPGTTAEIKYTYPQVPSDLVELQQYINNKEAQTSNIKKDNHAQIVWANDSLQTKTEYVLVYLHGFSASHEEGAPAHESVAKAFGMNLFLSRLSHHGIEGPDAMGNLTAESLMETALEAVSIAKQLGDKVILMGTSTGATLGIPMMAHDPNIHAGIFFSPNIDLADPKSDLLTKPGGLSLAKTILGSDYYSFDPPPGAEQFWTNKYPISATIELQTLLNSTMHKETFEKVKQAILLVAYYKNEDEQDKVVSVQAMKDCFAQLGTEKNKKRYVELTDVGKHAMCSPFFSSNIDAPIETANEFIEEVLGISKIQ